MREIDGDLIRRAIPSQQDHRSDRIPQGLLIVDSRESCLQEAGELIQAGVKGKDIHEIGELITIDRDGEGFGTSVTIEADLAHRSGGVTIFKSVGVSLQDVAIAAAVKDKAQDIGVGTVIEGYE